MLEFGTQTLATIIGLILIFGIVVIIHELGHYWAGRISGAKIEGFSIGFGKALIERADKRGTKWRLSALPFGGYVNFVSCGQAAKDPALNALTGLAYEDVGPWKRNFISAAGPLANFILAILLFAGLSMWSGITTSKVMIGDVEAGKAADMAGLQYGDHILSVNGQSMNDPRVFVQSISLAAEEELRLEIARAGNVLELAITPKRVEQTTGLGHKVKMGFIGAEVGVADMQTVTPSIPQAVMQGISRTGQSVSDSAKVIGRIFSGKDSVHMLTGPIGIGDMARRVYVTATEAENVPTKQRISWTVLTLIHLCALISIGIGFFNILPFPILDGGHIVINTYEAITGSMMPEVIQEYSMRFGLFCLIGLFVYISVGDLWDVGLIS